MTTDEEMIGLLDLVEWLQIDTLVAGRIEWMDTPRFLFSCANYGVLPSLRFSYIHSNLYVRWMVRVVRVGALKLLLHALIFYLFFQSYLIGALILIVVGWLDRLVVERRKEIQNYFWSPLERFSFCEASCPCTYHDNLESLAVFFNIFLVPTIYAGQLTLDTPKTAIIGSSP
jgi:hypothetical protein